MLQYFHLQIGNELMAWSDSRSTIQSLLAGLELAQKQKRQVHNHLYIKTKASTVKVLQDTKNMSLKIPGRKTDNFLLL